MGAIVFCFSSWHFKFCRVRLPRVCDLILTRFDIWFSSSYSSLSLLLLLLLLCSEISLSSVACLLGGLLLGSLAWSSGCSLIECYEATYSSSEACYSYRITRLRFGTTPPAADPFLESLLAPYNAPLLSITTTLTILTEF